MKRFQFAQQRLLNVREQQRRLLKSRVAVALAAWHEARMGLQAAEQDLEEISKRVAEQQVDVVQTYQSVPAAQRQIDLARQRLVESDTRLEQAREDLRQISVAVESLDTLRSLRRQEYMKQQQAEQQKEVEFTVLRRWARDQAKLREEVGND